MMRIQHLTLNLKKRKKKASSAARVFAADGDIFFKIVVLSP